MRWLCGVQGVLWALLTCLLGLPGSRKGAAALGGELYSSPHRLCTCVCGWREPCRAVSR